MTRTRPILIAVVVAIVAIVGGMLAARVLLERDAARIALADGTAYDPPRPLPEFSLTDQHGAPFARERLEGRWSLVFFGFTSCPDVCPTTLALLAQSEKALGALPATKRPQVVLLSVDPEHDTPAQLAAYVNAFSPTFTGVTGSADAIDALARAMGVAVARRGNSVGGYSIDHSAAVFLVGPDATLRALFSRPRDPQLLAADYRRVVSAGG